MSLEASVWADEQRLRPLPKLLLLMLADSTGCDGVAVTSDDSLLRRTGMTPEELEVALKDLEAGGYISPAQDIFGADGWRMEGVTCPTS